MFWLSDVFTGTESAQRMSHYEARARGARARLVRQLFAVIIDAVRKARAVATRGAVRDGFNSTAPRRCGE